MRVRLIKSLDHSFLPVGTTGTKIGKDGIEKDGSLAPGMHVIRWDWKLTIPMYRHEIEQI